MRLRKIGQYMEAFEGKLSGDDQKLVDTIIAAGDNISVDVSDPAFAEPKNPDGKKTDTKKKSAKKTAKRIDCVCAMLKKLPDKGASIEQVAKLANQMYVKGGGDDNVKQTIHHLRVVMPTLQNFDIIKVEDGKLFPVK